MMKKYVPALFLFFLCISFNSCSHDMKQHVFNPAFKIPVEEVKLNVFKIMPYQDTKIRYEILISHNDTISKCLAIRMKLDNIDFSNIDFYEQQGKKIATVVKHGLKNDSLYKRYLVEYTCSKGESGHLYQSHTLK